MTARMIWSRESGSSARRRTERRRADEGDYRSEIARVRDELAESQRQVELERKRTEWANQHARNIENSRRAVKAHLTRVKNRVGRGVCPCCRRSFENLQRHMKTKHPRYAGDSK